MLTWINAVHFGRFLSVLGFQIADSFLLNDWKCQKREGPFARFEVLQLWPLTQQSKKGPGQDHSSH